jgi:hypothetical protein
MSAAGRNTRAQLERLKRAALRLYETRSKPDEYRAALVELEHAALAYGSWNAVK